MGRSAFSRNAGPASGDGGSLEPGNAPRSEFVEGSPARGGLYKPDAIDTASLPRKVKVDLDTPFEGVWYILMAIAGFAAAMVFNAGALGGKKNPPDPELLVYLPIPLVLLAVFYICRRCTDNFYVLDLDAGKILYHFEFFGNVKTTRFKDFSEIRAAAVTGERRQNKGSSWWIYKIVLVDAAFTLIDFSDHVKEQDLSGLNEKAAGMAAMIGCLCGGCAPRTCLAVRPYAASDTDILYKTELEYYGDEKTCYSDLAQTKIELSATFWIVVVTIILAFIVMMRLTLIV